MAIANAAQALASEQERVSPILDDLTLQASPLRKRVEKDTTAHPVSDRPCRLPTMPSRGGKPRVGNMNGADMGIGSGPTQVVGQATTVCYIHAFSYTKQAEYATDSDEKAIENFATLTRSIAPKQFANFLEVQMQQAGDNKIDTVVSVVTSGGNITGLVVNNANFFLADEDLDVWTGTGGSFVTTVTCQINSIASNTLWLANPVPSGTITPGMGLFVNQSSGQANTGTFGLRYYQVATDTGNWLTIQRSSWPGQYTAQNIPVNGALTPQIVRAIQYQIELKMGDDAEESALVAHCNVDAIAAWEQNALLVQHIDMAQLKGAESEDMLRKNAPKTIGGVEFLKNPRALPGYIDFIALKNCSTIETKPVDFYNVGPNTLFGIIGQSGGQASALVFYMVAEFQFIMRKTIENAFLSGISIPKGLFGQ